MTKIKHPQSENLIIAANDEDALFSCGDWNKHHPCPISTVMMYPNSNWTHVKPYEYQHVKDAYEADKSLVVQCRRRDCNSGWTTLVYQPLWENRNEYRIKPKPITKRLYANAEGYVVFKTEPHGAYIIPINGTDTEVECE